jgi:hypothetical protein
LNMDRIKHLNRFYDILLRLESKTGTRMLASCDNHMEWPQHGVCFFFEHGEFRDNGTQMRVVQVTIANSVTDPLSPLWNRLRQHRGTISGKFAGGGNHRVSDFRSNIGNALINREKLAYPSWEVESSNAATRKQEHPLEVEVSRIINHMPFLWLSTDYSSNPIQLSQFINRNAVSLLSNHHRKIKYDQPSEHWLGHYCSDPVV